MHRFMYKVFIKILITKAIKMMNFETSFIFSRLSIRNMLLLK